MGIIERIDRFADALEARTRRIAGDPDIGEIVPPDVALKRSDPLIQNAVADYLEGNPQNRKAWVHSNGTCALLQETIAQNTDGSKQVKDRVIEVEDGKLIRGRLQEYRLKTT
jgi:hypothetical protein